MKELIAITGAGISKASGIPTFDELGDLRDCLSREYFNSYPDRFYEILLEMKSKIDIASPNDAHIALSEFNIPIITMNIDGLHNRAGSKDVVEIHGNLEQVFCYKCKAGSPFNMVADSIYCPQCDEILEPNVVLYGDGIPMFHEALYWMGGAKRLLVVGTSFYTSTVCDLVTRAKYAGIPVDIINENAETDVRKYLNSLFKK